MASTRTVVVTGANRGIGRAICELVLSHPSNNNSSSRPLVLYATSRAGSDLGLSTSNAPPKSQVLYHPLDISKSSSIKLLLSEIQSNKHSPISILINNAGVNLDDNFNPENAHKTLEVNYRGTLNVCRAFLPYMDSKSDSRIVNVSSVGSSLNPYSKEKAERLRNASTLSELDELVSEYLSAVDKGAEGKAGFPQGKSYSISKAAINSFTKTLAKENPNVTINCCCPGWVDTDMGNMIGQPPKRPQDGAKIPVRLALADLGGVTGKYFADDSVMDKGEGKVQPW